MLNFNIMNYENYTEFELCLKAQDFYNEKRYYRAIFILEYLNRSNSIYHYSFPLLLSAKKEQGDYLGVIEYSNKLISLGKHDDDIYYHLGMAHFYNNNFSASLYNLLKSSRMGNRFADFFIEDKFCQNKLISQDVP